MNFDIRALDARALDFHWRVKDDLSAAAGLTELGRSSYRRARNSVLASLVLAGDSDRPWVSYSRSRDFYAAEGRYEGTDYTYANVRLAVAELAEAGLIEEMRSAPGSHLTHGFQSRMLATDRLMSLAEGVDLTYAGTRCPIVLKSEDGMRIDFRETARTRRFVAEVEEVNAYLGQIQVGISADASSDDWQHTRHHIRARKIKDGSETWTCVRPTPSPEVFRVFGRGRWDRHGRWYGWWQNLPKERRAELLINNELCIEPDFACLHPTLLYALRGVDLQHDPYHITGWPRSAGKLALNVAINAPTMTSAIQALLNKRGDVRGDGSPAWAYGPGETRRIVDAVQRANPAIANDIGSDAGVRLMAIDSGMAHRVMTRCRAEAIPVLPVHDSFVAPGSKGAAVTAIMGEVLAHTISTISPSRSGGSVQSIRYTPSGGAPERAELPSSLEETSPAEPEIAPSPEGMGYTLPVLETPCPEALGGPAAGVTSLLPEGKESPLSGGTGSPSPEAVFRPVLALRPSLRLPVLRPVVDLAPPSPPVPSQAPVSTRPPLPAFIQVLLDEERTLAKAAAEAAARAAAQVRESPVPPPRRESKWAPLPPRQNTPAPVPVVPVATLPAPPPVSAPRARIETSSPSQVALLAPSAPAPIQERVWPRMSREEVSANLRMVVAKLDARKAAKMRQTFR